MKHNGYGDNYLLIAAGGMGIQVIGNFVSLLLKDLSSVGIVLKKIVQHFIGAAFFNGLSVGVNSKQQKAGSKQSFQFHWLSRW